MPPAASRCSPRQPVRDANTGLDLDADVPAPRRRRRRCSWPGPATSSTATRRPLDGRRRRATSGGSTASRIVLSLVLQTSSQPMPTDPATLNDAARRVRRQHHRRLGLRPRHDARPGRAGAARSSRRRSLRRDAAGRPVHDRPTAPRSCDLTTGATGRRRRVRPPTCQIDPSATRRRVRRRSSSATATPVDRCRSPAADRWAALPC